MNQPIAGSVVRKPKFSMIYVIFILCSFGLFVLTSFSCQDSLFDLDNDNHLSSWIKQISITDSENEPDYGADVRFSINFEIWNPGSFRIKYQSSHTAWGFPWSCDHTNVPNVLNGWLLPENDEGGLMCSSKTIPPGIHIFNWTGSLFFTNSVPETYPFLPEGNFTFRIGNNDWIQTYNYTIQVKNNTITHYPTMNPPSWGENTIQLGNPYWYLFGIPLIVIISFNFRYIYQKKKIKTNNS